MLVVLSICQKDVKQALKLSQWIKELGGVLHHSIVLAASKACIESKTHEPIVAELKQAFRQVDVYPCSDIPDPAWPRGANHAFIRVCKDVIQNDPGKPFFWLEPDAIPLKSTWMNDIEAEYLRAGKPFMGSFVRYENTKDHMSGVGIYRQIDSHAPSYVLSHEYAFDIVISDSVLPKAHFTELIQHEWKTDPSKILEQIKPEAVIYHQDKTGVIIDHLRGRGCAVSKSTEGVIVSPLHAIPAPPVKLNERELIEMLVDISKRSPLDRGRIIKQLRKHKLST